MKGERVFSPKEGQRVDVPATVTGLSDMSRTGPFSVAQEGPGAQWKLRLQVSAQDIGDRAGWGSPLTSNPQSRLERGRASAQRSPCGQVQEGSCAGSLPTWWTLQEGRPAVRCSWGPFLATRDPHLCHAGNE